MINIIKKRILPVVVCFAIMLSAFAYRPQKVEAVALTSTAVIASVAAIMTACGVSYWANTQQDAISYLGGKIDDYLDTLSNTELTYEDWLGISDNTSLFTVIGNGILSFGSSVANKILEFVRWFNQEESITSGGQSVGEFGQNIEITQTYNNAANYQYKCEVVDNKLNFTYNFAGNYYASGTYYLVSIPRSVVDTDYVKITLTSINLRFNNQAQTAITFRTYGATSTGQYQNNYGDRYTLNTSHTYSISKAIPYINLSLPVNNYQSSNSSYLTGTFTLQLDGALFCEEDKAVVTPSASVAVPNAISDGQTLDVTTNANISQGDNAEDATSAILGTVTDVGGLTSTNDVSGQAVPSESIWLWKTITSLPETIAEKVGDLFIPSEDFADTFAETAYGIFDNHFSILSYPFSLIGEFSTRLLTLGNPQPIFKWNDLNDPFSGKKVISAGQYNLNDALSNTAVLNLYNLYMLLVKAIISFQFVNFLYAWFCDVFKMKESDYPLPWDSADGDDDAPDDGDGYDGTWSSW